MPRHIRLVFLNAGRPTKVDICILDEKFGVYIAEYPLVRLDNSFHIDIDEEIVRVDVLLDKPLDLEKGRKKVPFVLNHWLVAATRFTN